MLVAYLESGHNLKNIFTFFALLSISGFVWGQDEFFDDHYAKTSSSLGARLRFNIDGTAGQASLLRYGTDATCTTLVDRVYFTRGSYTFTANTAFILDASAFYTLASASPTQADDSTTYYAQVKLYQADGYNAYGISDCIPYTCSSITSTCTQTNSLLTYDFVASPVYAYISPNNANLYRCEMDSTYGNFAGNATSSACTALTNSTSPGFSTVLGATFANFSNQTYAYIGDNSARLWQCPISEASGALSSGCTALTKTVSFGNTFARTPQTFGSTTYIYVSRFASTFYKCPMDDTYGNFAGNATSTACTALSGTTSLGSITGVEFYTFSSTTYAYITGFSTKVWRCPMDSSTGNFTGDTTSTACTGLTAAVSQLSSPHIQAPAFQNASGITFLNSSGTVYAYVGDQSSNVWKCPMDNSTGGFSSSCTGLTNTPAFTDSNTPRVHQFNGTNYLYLPDGANHKFWQCPLTSTGTFATTCTALTNSTLGNFTSASEINFYAP